MILGKIYFSIQVSHLSYRDVEVYEGNNSGESKMKYGKLCMYIILNYCEFLLSSLDYRTLFSL